MLLFSFLKSTFVCFPVGGASAAYGPDGAGMGYMMDGSQQMHIRPPGQTTYSRPLTIHMQQKTIVQG